MKYGSFLLAIALAACAVDPILDEVSSENPAVLPDVSFEQQTTRLCGTPNNCYWQGADYSWPDYPTFPKPASTSSQIERDRCAPICGTRQGANPYNGYNHTMCGILSPGPNPGNHYASQCQVSGGY